MNETQCDSNRKRHISSRNPLDVLALVLIAFYQRHLSPRKGWRCAYSVLNGGPGCSGFARQTIEKDGWQAAIPLVRQRFRDCKHAALAIRALSQNDPFEPDPSTPLPSTDEQHKRKNKGNGHSGGSNDCDCSEPSCHSCATLPDLAAFQHCHMPSCDFGACDFGGCEHCHIGCDACDCGGCH